MEKQSNQKLSLKSKESPLIGMFAFVLTVLIFISLPFIDKFVPVLSFDPLTIAVIVILIPISLIIIVRLGSRVELNYPNRSIDKKVFNLNIERIYLNKLSEYFLEPLACSRSKLGNVTVYKSKQIKNISEFNEFIESGHADAVAVNLKNLDNGETKFKKVLLMIKLEEALKLFEVAKKINPKIREAEEPFIYDQRKYFLEKWHEINPVLFALLILILSLLMIAILICLLT